MLITNNNDGRTNATQTIRDAYNSISALDVGMLRKGTKLEFNTGIYKVTDTILFQTAMGLVITGNGRSGRRRNLWPKGGPALSPEYVFMAVMGDSLSGAVFKITGSENKIADMDIWGRTDSSKTKSLVGIHWSKGAGIGTGGSLISNVCVSDCQVGIKHGDGYYDSNCDLNHFDKLRLFDCDIGLQFVNSQSVGHYVSHVDFFHVPLAIDFQGGGTTNFGKVGLEGGVLTLLKTGRQGNTNEQILFDGVYVDGGNGAIPVFVEATGTNNPTTVIINNISVPSDLSVNNNALFNLNSRNRVIVNSAQYLKGTIAQFSNNVYGDLSELFLNNCRFDMSKTNLIHAGSQGNYRLVLKNCYDMYKRLPDQEITTEYGVPLKLTGPTITRL
jgi:hypothetical protein